MTNTELEDIEAALRRGAAVDVDTQAEAATLSAIAAADRQGLIDVAVSTVDSPVGDLLVAVTPQGLVRLAFDPTHVLDDLADRISPRVVEAPARLDLDRPGLARARRAAGGHGGVSQGCARHRAPPPSRQRVRRDVAVAGRRSGHVRPALG